MITERDREIINHVYRLGFISIEQCSKIFFQESNYAYDLARKRLKKISMQTDYIKALMNQETKQLIYIPEDSKRKKVSKHDLLIMDYIAEILNIGVEVENIEIEKDFGGVVADAFIVFQFSGYRYYQILEVQLRHDFVNVLRYKSCMSSILSLTNNTIPKIIIIQNTNKDYEKDNDTGMDIVQLKVDLEGVAKVLL